MCYLDVICMCLLSSWAVQGCAVPAEEPAGEWRLAPAAHQRRVQPQLHDLLLPLQVLPWLCLHWMKLCSIAFHASSAVLSYTLEGVRAMSVTFNELALIIH